jgi:hypothetical protein
MAGAPSVAAHTSRRWIMTLGPVDLLVVKFPGNQFKGEIAPALTELVESGTIRVIDILFANKDENGTVEMVEVNDLDDDDVRRFDPVVTDVTDMLDEEDVRTLTGALEPNSSAALLLFESTWATRFRNALAHANAELVLYEHLPRAVIDELTGEEVATTSVSPE